MLDNDEYMQVVLTFKELVNAYTHFLRVQFHYIINFYKI